jgi:hypothetical protein
MTSEVIFAFTCKQTETTPIALTHERTTLLASQFGRIDHIEVLPQTINPDKGGYSVESVQILMCGELKPETPAAINTPGQTCQFDSNCQQPMRCQNSLCVLPQ